MFGLELTFEYDRTIKEITHNALTVLDRHAAEEWTEVVTASVAAPSNKDKRGVDDETEPSELGHAFYNLDAPEPISFIVCLDLASEKKRWFAFQKREDDEKAEREMVNLLFVPSKLSSEAVHGEVPDPGLLVDFELGLQPFLRLQAVDGNGVSLDPPA